MTVGKRTQRPQLHTEVDLWRFPGCVKRAVSPEEGAVSVKSNRTQLFLPEGVERRGGHGHRLLMNSWVLRLPRFPLDSKNGCRLPYRAEMPVSGAAHGTSIANHVASLRVRAGLHCSVLTSGLK